jgi:hypothetical protein
VGGGKYIRKKEMEKKRDRRKGKSEIEKETKR